MFPAKEVRSLPFSAHLDTAEYRGTKAAVAAVDWEKITNPSRKDQCEECAWVQDETYRAGGTPGLRYPPRQIRRLPEGPELRLCSLHAQGWDERDAHTLG